VSAKASVNGNTVAGGELYRSNCLACHGSNPRLNQNGIWSGRDASVSRVAINRNVGGMVFLSSLTDQNLSDIAAWIQTH